MPVWDQIQADIYGRPVVSMADPDATLVGAAMLGAYGVGAFPSIQAAAARMVRIGKTFKPDSRQSKRYDAVYQRFSDAIAFFLQHGAFKKMSG